MCKNGTWVPQVTVHVDAWVFGVTNNDQRGGVLHFREVPQYPCERSCSEVIPVVYRCDVVSVPYEGGDYSHEDVSVTYIPKGRYVVTSPDFRMHYNMRLWYFPDNGEGPHLMEGFLQTDKQRYGQEDTSVQVVLQIQDEKTQENIAADSISGIIYLPDNTHKTIDYEDWSWNDEEPQYEYVWDFLNDDGVCADPKEGHYTVEVYIKKKYYKDAIACAGFDVCSHLQIALEFDETPPEYTRGKSVNMIVYVTDENGSPFTGEVESLLILPDGTAITDLSWVHIDAGSYATSYLPHQEGVHHITIRAKEDDICYLEEASHTFYVKECQKALVSLEISDAIIDEPVTFVLTVTDDQGTLLTGGTIESGLYLFNEYIAALTWTDQKDGTYTAEHTPSEPGQYSICGTVTVLGEKCFKKFFDKPFTVTEKRIPDLVIRNEDITIEPEPYTGDTVTISVTVWNTGTGDAEGFLVIILINDEIVHREVVDVLPAGECITIEYEWTVLYSGGYTIQAVADPPEELL
jgi:hypothetical protein